MERQWTHNLSGFEKGVQITQSGNLSLLRHLPLDQGGRL